VAHLQLSADHRTETGNGPARRLRRRGLVPGVVYQPGSPSIAFSLPDRELRRVLLGDGGRTSVIDLRVGESAARPVIFKDWQLDPVRGGILHIDFQEVDLAETIEMQVQVVLEGNPVGVREDGGVLDHALREVTVKALPDAMPDAIPHDVSELGIGAAITVADLRAPEGSEITTEPEHVVASVLTPTVEPEPEEEEEVEELEGVEGEEPGEAAPEDAGEDAGQPGGDE
jgi:large subunit ribosomal protein L25